LTSTFSKNYRFRCIGLADPSCVTLNNNPACQDGNCFSLVQSRSPIIADNIDRPAATYSAAFTTCHNLGADLPNQAEFSDYLNVIIRWLGTGTSNWVLGDAETSAGQASSLNNYRCLWRSRTGNLPTNCNATQSIKRTGDSFSCEDSVDGNSNGNSTTITPITDAWGNAWDEQSRTAASHQLASDICINVGARLPSANEIYLDRAESTTKNFPIGLANKNLWSNNPSIVLNNFITVGSQLGDVVNSLESTAHEYHCIWPSTKGTVLSGRSCNGPTTEPCFQTITRGSINSKNEQIIADASDRLAMDITGALSECQQAGGKLPNFREFNALAHNGWKNGVGNLLWIGTHSLVFK